MRDADIATAAAGSAPQWRVRVSDQQEERRSRTLTRGIQVAEYELSVALDFEVLDAAGNALHPTQRLSASRVYEREQENLLTNEAEEEVLWDELRRDVAAQLVAAVAVQLGAGASRPAADAPAASGG
jgi:outer membrane lipopolysaccharide assembly protein LptE/RlpB